MEKRGAIMTEYIQVLTTVEQKADAEKIVKSLLEKHLAACAQIIGQVIFTGRGNWIQPGNTSV
jgi:uncharacterized protein involved in tolerance to divalent cations